MKKLQQSVFSRVAILAIAFTLIATFNGCSVLKDLSGLSNLQFNLQNVQGLQLAGVDITNKRSISDFSIADGLRLTQAFATNQFPLTFTLNVGARNPNQASGTSGTGIQLTNFPWHLMVDGNETISGNIGAPVGLPSAGNTTTIPLQVSLDLKQFFGNRGYNDMLNLALALAGQGAAKLQLKATPSLKSSFASYTWPHEITIVSTEFRN